MISALRSNARISASQPLPSQVDVVVIVSDNESWVDPSRRGATATMNEWTKLKARNRVEVVIAAEGDSDLLAFERAVAASPDILECHLMAGEYDYLLRVVVPDIAAYDQVYKRLTAGTQLFDVSSSFAMEELKLTTALPLSYVK